MKQLWNSYYLYLIGTIALYWVLTKTGILTNLGSLTRDTVRRMSQRRARTGQSPEPLGFWGWCKKHHNPILLTLQWTGLVVATGLVVGGFWWSKVFSLTGLILIICWTIYGYTGAPGQPFRWKLSTIGIWFCIGVAILFVFKETALGKKIGEKANAFYQSIVSDAEASSPPSPNYDFPADLQENEGARRAYGFWMASGLPLHDSFEMWKVCGAESNWRQFETDGTTPLVGKNADGTPNGAIGICQIKPGSWQEEADRQGHNLKTEEGNLQMALWIRKNVPDWESKWETLAQVRKEMGAAPANARVVPPPSYKTATTYIVPVGTWSSVVDVSSSPCHLSPDRPMKARDQDGREYDFAPGKVPQTSVFSFTFMAESEPAGNMVVRCY